ncbi:MAG: type II CAAX endopeptidase family protein [Chloroflexi bacterium]|nr:type II CAAX endopeptidase family protein [Chloroflexota bacterium]
MIATSVTLLVVVAIFSLGGVAGTNAGFETLVTRSSGLLLGGLSALAALTLVRVTRSPMLPVALTLLLGVGVVVIGYMLASDAGDGTAEVIGVPVSIIAASAMSGSFAVTGIAFSTIRYREPLGSLGFVRTVGLKPYFFAAGIWLIGLSVLVVWVQMLMWLEVDLLLPPETARGAIEQAGGNIVITVLLVGVAGPIAEEIFFRGFVLTGLLKRFGVRRSLLLSSLIFGLFHLDSGAIVPTFALGLALGWVYLKTGSIWPAMFAHGLHNTVAVLIARYATAA